MQKKVLLPLLLAGPVALPAFADIDYGFPNVTGWTQAGISGSDFNVDGTNNSISTTQAGGWVTSQKIALPQGKFKLSFDKATNISVYLNAEVNEGKVTGTLIGSTETQEESPSGLNCEFTLDSAQEVTITIIGYNPAYAFSFQGQQLQIIVEASTPPYTAKWAADQALNALPTLNPYDRTPHFSTGNELEAKIQEFKTLSEKNLYPISDDSSIYLGKVQNEINAVVKNTGDYTLEERLEIYNKYGLYETPNLVVQYYENLTTYFKNGLKEEIDAENAAYLQYTQNRSSYDYIKGLYDECMAQYNSLADYLQQSENNLDPQQIENFTQRLAEIKKSIDDNWLDVEEAYPDPEDPDANANIWRNLIEFDGWRVYADGGEIKNDLGQLQQDISNGNADWDMYYKVNFVLLPKLKTAYDQLYNYAYSSTTTGISGYGDKYLDVYKSLINEIMDNEKTGATPLYNKVKTLLIPEVEGAVDWNTEHGNVTEIEAATTYFTNEYTYLSELVKNQNEAMTTALGKIADFNTALDKYLEDGKPMTVASQFQEEFDDQIEAIQKAIAALQVYVDGEYEKHNLNVNDTGVAGGYSVQVDVIQTLLDALKDYADSIQYVSDLNKDLKDAWEEVEELDTPEFKVSKKFDDTRNALQNAIDALTPEDSDQDTVLQKQIEKMVQDAEQMAGWYKEIAQAIEKGYTAMSAFQNLIENKMITNQFKHKYFQNTYDAIQSYLKDEDSSYNQLLSNVNKWKQDLADAIAPDVTGQTCHDMLAVLVTHLDGITSGLESAELAFESDITRKYNYQNTFDYIIPIQFTVVEDDQPQYGQYYDPTIVGLPGYETAKAAAENLNNELNVIMKALPAENTTPDASTIQGLIKQYTDADEAMLNLLDDAYDAQQQIDQVKDNKAAYDQMMARLEDLQSQMNKLVQYNARMSKDNGRDFFVTDVFPEMFEELAKLTAAIQDAYDANQANIKMGGDDGLQAGLNDFQQDITNTYIWIDNNNTSHDSQVKTGTETEESIQDIINDIDNLLSSLADEGVTSGAAVDALNGWKKDLENLLETSEDPLNLEGVNSLVSNSYGTGKSFDNNEEIEADYAALMEAAEKIKDDFRDEYPNKVKDANEATTNGWSQTVTDLTNDYLGGIQDYNYFYYNPGLTNPGWKAYVEENNILETHEALFNFYAEIQDLNTTVKEWIKTQNEDGHVITKDEWDYWMGQAESIQSNIEKAVSSFISDMNTAAVDYYAILSGKVNSAISEAKQILTGQGIPTSYLDTVEGYVTTASGMYNTAVDYEGPAVAQTVGGAMNEIANELDKALPPYDYQAWAEAQWEEEWGNYEDKYDDWQDALTDPEDPNYKDYQYADPEVREEQMGIIDDLNQKANELNDKVAETTEGLIEDYGEYSDELDDIMNQIEQAMDAIKESSKYNKAEQDAQEQWAVQYIDLMETWNAMNEYARSLAGCATPSLGGPIYRIYDDIEDLNTKVTTSGDVTTWNPSLDSQVSTLENRIGGEYPEIATVETTYLKSLYKDARVAFNNAKEYINSLNGENEPAIPVEGFDDWDAYFEYLQNVIGEFEGTLGTDNTIWSSKEISFIDDMSAWKAKSIQMEKDLCDVIIPLESIYPEDSNYAQNPLPGLIANLEDLATQVSEALTSAQDALAGYQYLTSEQMEDYTAEYAELKTQLEAEDGSWENEGDWLLARYEFHRIALQMLLDRVEYLADQAEMIEDNAGQMAQQQAQNQAAWDALSADFTDLQALWETVKSTIGTYDESAQTDVVYNIRDVNNNMSKFYEELDAAYKAGILYTQVDSFNSQYETLGKQISYVQTKAARTQVGYLLTLTQEARDNASDAIKQTMVPEVQAQLVAKFNTLNVQLNALLGSYASANYETSVQNMTQANYLTEEFNNIVATADENVVYLGDLNDEPDGLIDISDLQIMINLIGSGITYEELYAENPRLAIAADVTEDGILNVADITKITDMMLAYDANSDNIRYARKIKFRAAKAGVIDLENKVSVALVNDENGIRTYALMLNNPTEFLAGQIDFRISGNAAVTEIYTTERTQNHNVYTFDNSVNNQRIIITSMMNNAIAGDSGEIIFFDVEGKGDVTIDNIIFSDGEFNAHELQSSTTTGVTTIFDKFKEYGEKIYDAAGRAYNRVQKGINIIRHKDGSVTKEIRK